MKGKSLFKKIAAAATTVAMLASVSVVGFAAPEDGNAENFNSANKVVGTVGFTENTTTNAFDFEVEYTQNATDNIGVTMLAYKVGTGDTIASGYNGTGTNVVGIAQNGAAEATKKFTFSVAKDDGEGDDSKELAYGDEVIVLLSSDGAANAVGYLTKITATADSVALADGFDVVVEVDYGKAEDTTEIENKVSISSVDVKLVKGDASESITVDKDLEVTGITGTAGAYKATVKLPAINGSTYSIAAGQTVSVPLVIQQDIWTADTATYVDKVSVDPTIDNGADLKAAVIAALADKSVTLNDTEKGYTYAYELTGEVINAGKLYKTVDTSEVEVQDGDVIEENDTFTYKVTVPAGTYDNNLVTVAEGGLVATITVEVKEAAPAYIVGDANLDGKVDGKDWQKIANHLTGNILSNEFNDTTSLGYKAANVTGGNLDGKDWQAIANHLTGNILSDTIGKPAQ